MKSKVIEDDKIEDEVVYPCLMKGVHSGTIYFLPFANRAIVLVGEEEIGETYHNANAMDLVPFNGTIELSN